MLRPAVYEKFPVEQLFMLMAYSDDMFWYSRGTEFELPNWIVDPNKYQYAVVDDVREDTDCMYEKTIDNEYTVGYMEYEVDWATRSVRDIKIISFYKGNVLFVKEVYKKIQELISDFDRLEFDMVRGCPIEKHLDRFVKAHHGEKHVLHNCIIDRHGKIHDRVIYEIITKHSET